MTPDINMTSNRPYLLKAFYQWIVDNECTPYIVVEADLPHVSVPPQTVKDGQVVLNIAPSAVQSLLMDNKQITFSARFGGVPFEVYIPIYAISAIYARENGAGTMFPPEELPDIDDEIESDLESKVSKVSVVQNKSIENTIIESKSKDKDGEKSKKKDKASHLSVVK